MFPDNSTLPDIGAMDYQLNSGALAYLRRVASTEGDTMAQIGLASVSFGALTILFCTAMHVLVSRGSAAQTNGRILLFGTVLLYLSTATYMGALIWSWSDRNYFAERANNGLFSPSFDWEKDSAVLKHAVRQQSHLLTLALGANFLIGDAIVWWRACVIWQHRVVTCVGPLLVVAAMCCSIAGMSTPEHVSDSDAIRIMFGGGSYGPASLIISFSTNVLATSLISYKAWKHRQLLREHFAEARPTSRVLKALALLTESGCIYCALMIFVIAYHLDPTTTKAGPNFVFEAVSNDFEYGCLVPLVAIYPTTIIAIVALKQSPIDTGGLSQVRQAQVHRRGSGPGLAPQGGTASTIVFNHSTGFYNPSVVVDIQSTIEQKPTPAGYGSTHSRETSRSEDETKIMPENLV